MKKCAYCGSRLRKKDLYCPYCGTETREDLFCVHAAAETPAKHVRIAYDGQEKKVSRVNGCGIAAFVFALLSAAALFCTHAHAYIACFLVPAGVLMSSGLAIGCALGKRKGLSIVSLIIVVLVCAAMAYEKISVINF